MAEAGGRARRVIVLATGLVLMAGIARAFSGLPGARGQVAASPMDLATLYSLGRHEEVAAALQQAAGGHLSIVLEAFEAEAAAWIDADGPDWADRRRLLVATVALEAAYAGLDTQWRTSRDLVAWACELLRRRPPTPGEREWHLAAVALIEGARDVDFLGAHARHVASRFPDEPRVRLAQAFRREYDYLNEIGYLGPEHGPGRRIGIYDEALADPGSVREARLRLAFLLLQARRFDEALDQVRQIEPAEDPGQRYLARLFEAWVHQRRDPPDLAAAEASFRGALEAVPGAYTASLSVALLLYPTDRRMEADRIMNASAEAEPPVVDPWRIYGYGDLRLWPRRIAAVREHLR